MRGTDHPEAPAIQGRHLRLSERFADGNHRRIDESQIQVLVLPLKFSGALSFRCAELGHEVRPLR